MSSDTPAFNLKAVIRETGLKPDTLRAWERRYGLPQPQRTAGKHRLYSQRDIDLLKWLIARQREGLSISRAVDMWNSLEAEGRDPLQMAASARASSAAPATGDAVADLREKWIAACLAFDERTAEQALGEAFACFPPETVYFELLQKGLAQMGDGWYRGEVTVQQEHFASELAMRRLEALVAATPAPTRSGRILAGCPPQEEHTFSLLLVTLLLRRQGWDVVYLGANVPLSQLETALASARPQLMVSAAQQLHTVAALWALATFLQQQRVPLAYGGAPFNGRPELRARIPGHFLGEQTQQAPQAVQQVLAAPWLLPPIEEASEAYRQALNSYREHQPQIEAQVWDTLRSIDIPHAHLTIANMNVARNLTAALELGDLDLIGRDVTWIEGLLRGHRIPTETLQRYLEAYARAARTCLDERGRLLIDWLDAVLSKSLG